MVRFLTQVLFVIAVSGSTLLAQKINDRIAIITQTDLGAEEENFAKIPPATVLTVEDVKQNWLWITYNGNSGWIDKKDTVPLVDAIDYFTEQIRQNPRSAIPYEYRALIWQEKGEHNIALGDLGDAIRLSPQSPNPYFYRGKLNNLLGQFDQAIVDYSEFIRLNSKYSIAYNNRGFNYYLKEEDEKAIKDFDEAIRLDPNNAMAFNNRGLARNAQKDYKKAITDFNESIRINPKGVYVHGNRGDAWRHLGEHNKAIANYDEGIRISPNYAVYYNNRGLCWSSLQKTDKAIADFTEAVRKARRCIVIVRIPGDDQMNMKKQSAISVRPFRSCLMILFHCTTVECVCIPQNNVKKQLLISTR